MISGASLSKIKKKILPPDDGQDTLKLRTGVISAVNSDGTCDVTISGVTVAGVPKLAEAFVPVGSVVQLLTYRGSLLIIGASATSAIMSTAASSSTAAFSFTNTSGASGTDVVGVSFVAPPSGSVMISIGGVIWISSNTFRAILGWELRTGSVVGSGTLVTGPDYRYAIIAGRSVTTSGPNDIAATRRRKWSGLTPGSAYNVVAKHWVSGGTGNTDQREVIVEATL